MAEAKLSLIHAIEIAAWRRHLVTANTSWNREMDRELRDRRKLDKELIEVKAEFREWRRDQYRHY